VSSFDDIRNMAAGLYGEPEIGLVELIPERRAQLDRIEIKLDLLLAGAGWGKPAVDRWIAARSPLERTTDASTPQDSNP
jgi:hypothetical protein